MRGRRRRRLGGVLLVLAVGALAGCGGRPSEATPTTSTGTTSTTSTTSTPGPPATMPGSPTSPSPPTATARAADLYPRLVTGLASLGTVEVRARGTQQGRSFTREYAVDRTGDCSGAIRATGLDLAFVHRGPTTVLTTRTGSLGKALAGRWLVVDAASYVPFCLHGTNLVAGTDDEVARDLLAGTPLGPSTVDGQGTQHFRVTTSGGTRDVWLGSSSAGVVHVVRYSIRTGTTTLVEDFSMPGTGTLTALPPASQRFTRAQLDPSSVSPPSG